MTGNNVQAKYEKVNGIDTKLPILWTTARVDMDSLDDGYYLMESECTENCHHPIHAFDKRRTRHLIDTETVKTAHENNWWHDVQEQLDAVNAFAAELDKNREQVNQRRQKIREEHGQAVSPQRMKFLREQFQANKKQGER